MSPPTSPGRRAGLSSAFESLSWLLEISGLRRRALMEVAVLGVTAGLAQAAILLVIVRAAAAVTVQSEELPAAIGPFSMGAVTTGALIWIAVGLVLLYLLAEVASAWLIARMGARASQGFRREVLGHYSQAEWAAKAEGDGSSLVQLVTANANQAVTVLVTSAELVKFTGVFVTLILSSLVISTVGSLAMIIVMLGLFIVTLPLVRAAQRQARFATSLNRQFAKEVQEITTVGREVQIFGVQEESLAAAQELNVRQASLQFRRRLVNQLASVIFRVAALLLIVGALGLLNSVGPGNAASMAAVLLILLRSVSAGQAVQSDYQGVVETVPWIDQARERIAALVSHATSLRARPEKLRGADKQPIAVSVRNVSFEYLPGLSVLNGVDVEIDVGQCLGVIGRSGAGKTTFVELLLGLWDPTDGAILVDGQDLALIARDEWARRVAYVPQDPVLVSGSIEHNVQFFRRDVKKPDIRDAAVAASLTTGDAAVEFGLDVTTEAGRGISGGQRQRVAIARALAGQAGLIVLDEPTSALDVQSEVTITDTLDELRGRMTVVIVAHRLSTLDRCDRILVLSAGEVVAFGRPSELGNLRDYLDDGVH